MFAAFPGMAPSLGQEAASVQTPPPPPAVAAGYDHLLHRAYLPADFDQQVFDALWTVWEEPAKSQAEAADVGERRRMTMDRYGLSPHPLDPSRSPSSRSPARTPAGVGRASSPETNPS